MSITTMGDFWRVAPAGHQEGPHAKTQRRKGREGAENFHKIFGLRRFANGLQPLILKGLPQSCKSSISAFGGGLLALTPALTRSRSLARSPCDLRLRQIPLATSQAARVSPRRGRMVGQMVCLLISCDIERLHAMLFIKNSVRSGTISARFP